VHIGESAVKINTGADSSGNLETVYPLHVDPITGMFGFFVKLRSLHLFVV